VAATPGREERVAALFLDSGRRMSPGKHWEQVSAHASDLGRARVQRKSGWTGYVAEGGALIQAAAFCTIPAPSLAASHSALPRGRTRSATLKMRWSGRPQRQGNCPPISGADVGEASILGLPLLPTASVTLATAVRMAGCRRLTAPDLHERTLGVRRKTCTPPARRLFPHPLRPLLPAHDLWRVVRAASRVLGWPLSAIFRVDHVHDLPVSPCFRERDLVDDPTSRVIASFLP